jgi:hypothetical protein
MNESICEIDKFGNKYWYLNKLLHREGGPAIEYSNGDYSWYINGILHRLDGPAKDWNNCKEWYYHGKQIHCNSQKEFERLLRLKALW